MNTPETTNITTDGMRSRAYSPFWVLLCVFITLIFLQAWYVVEDVRERSQILAARARVGKVVTPALTITRTAENVGKELLALSAAKCAEADKIIAEFNIKLNTPPEAPGK